MQEDSDPDFSDPRRPSPAANRAEGALCDVMTKSETHNEDADTAMPQQLKPYAAKVLMKILYAARYTRLDLLRTVCALAHFITKWDEQ